MHLASRYSRLLLALSVALFGWESAQAEFFLPESVQVHGFASLGYFNTTDNNFFGDTQDDSGDVDFWELGINGSWQPLPNLQLSIQAVSRKAGETDDGGLRIDYGFLDYNFMSDVDDVWGVRGGRVVTPLGLYNDTRDMPFTRPSILLPQSIYLDINRQFALSNDGGQLYSQHRTDYGDFLFQFFGGLPRVDDPDFRNIFTRGVFPGHADSEPSFGGRLVYEKDGGLVRLAITGIQANVGYDSLGPGDLRSGSFTFEPLVFSAQYNAEQWSLTGEYARRRSKFKDFGPSLPDREFTGESFYVQGTYRFVPRWETMLRYDVLWWDTDDRDGKQFEAAAGGLVEAHSRFAKDWTIGIRWDITPSIMVRAEYHNVDGTGWVSDLDNPGGTQRYWNLFALLAAYRF